MDLPWEPTRSVWVCWSIQHHQRVGVSSFGPPHHSGFRVDVSARGAVRQKIRDVGKPLCSVGRSDLSSEGPQSCDPHPRPRGRAGNLWEAEEGRRVWDWFGICCRAPLCRQPGDGQGIVIPECCSVFLQQSRGPCRVPGPTVGMCRVLGVLLPPWDRVGSYSWPALTPRSWRCLRTFLLLIPVLFFGVVCEHSSDFCSAPLHSPILGSGTGEMVSGRGIYRAR